MQGIRKALVAVVAVATVGFVVAPTTANAAPASTPAAAQEFPSADSTVIGSTGFIDGEQVGYFWSAARGDSVAETFSGKNKIKKATLKIDVPYNGLVAGAHTDWDVIINGTTVGSFTVTSGQTGAAKYKFKFKKIKGKGTYDVKIAMTNEVAGGEGSMTLRYAGAPAHSIKLK
jgi:hypothetical protein